MSAEIVRLIRRPRHGDECTDFPAVAFRTIARESAAERTKAAPDAPPDVRRFSWPEP